MELKREKKPYLRNQKKKGNYKIFSYNVPGSANNVKYAILIKPEFLCCMNIVIKLRIFLESDC